MVIELQGLGRTPPSFEWEMRSAMPSKWSVGGFDAGTSKIADRAARDRAPRVPRRRHRLIGRSTPCPSPTSTQFGLVMRFDVDVDGIDLGAWSSCDGLQRRLRPQGDQGRRQQRFQGVPARPGLLSQARAEAGDECRRLRRGDGRGCGRWSTPPRATRRRSPCSDSHNATVSEWTFANVRPFVVEGPDARTPPARK